VILLLLLSFLSSYLYSSDVSYKNSVECYTPVERYTPIDISKFTDASRLQQVYLKKTKFFFDQSAKNRTIKEQEQKKIAVEELTRKIEEESVRVFSEKHNFYSSIIAGFTRYSSRTTYTVKNCK
jgi:hypothetical protein